MTPFAAGVTGFPVIPVVTAGVVTAATRGLGGVTGLFWFCGAL
jgi:hypothetical protein